MMKNILIIFFLFLSYNVIAQVRYPVGPPTQFSTGFFKQGYHQSDSGTIIANRDTNWLAKYSATIVFKPSNKKFYWFDSTLLNWNLLNGGRLDTAYNGLSVEGAAAILGGTLDRFTGIDNNGNDFFLHGTADNSMRTQNGVFLTQVSSTTIGASLIATNSSTTLFSEVNAVEGSAYLVGGRNGRFYNTINADSNSVFLATKSNVSPKRLILDTLGYITLDAYPSLTHENDTSTFKPVGINSSGKLVPMIGWASGSGAGLTSVGLSMPSAFTVSGSPLTNNGTINVSGAGTTAQYIRGNGTLATTDTGMIPNFYLKVRSLFSATSPLSYNSITGGFNVANANVSGQKGVATFLNSDFADNGAGLISLSPLVTNGSCTNCNITFGADGRANAYSNGVGPTGGAVDTIYRIPGIDSIYYTINSVVRAVKDSTGGGFSNANVGGGLRWVATSTGNIKTVFPSNTLLWDSTSNANGLTGKVDTSVIATQYDLTQLPIPSWQQTLNVSNTHTSTLYYDTTMVSNPATHEWANYAPLVKTDTATNAFHQWQNSGTNNGTRNEVMFWGWNVGPGGGNYTANRPSIGESWESNYQINPDGHSDRLMEKHEIYTPADGSVQHRLSSYTINTNTGTINFYHTVGNFSLYNVESHTPYYSILGTLSGGTTASWINSGNQSDYFSLNAEYNQDVNTSALTFGSSTSKPHSEFNLSNFTLARFPDASFTGQGYGGTALSFGGTTVGALANLVIDSSQSILLNVTNKPINFVIDGIQPLGMYKTKAVMAVPLSVNSTDITSAPFAGLQSKANASSLEAAGWFQQLGTNGTKYGIEVYATGASGENEGIYVLAQSGSANKSIRIQGPSAGADNYAIYADAAAQSYFAGKIGIGTASPDSTLHITGSIHTTAGVRHVNLPTAPGTKAVRIDANGTLSIADTSAGSAVTIYNGDGTLLADRNVASGGFTLRVAGANNSDTLVSIINSGTTSTGMYVSGTALGINAFSSAGAALQAIGSTRGAVITGDTDEGLLVKSNSVRGARIQTVPSSTNTVVEVLQLERGSTGGPGATGIGEYISFLNKTSTNSSDVSNTIISKFTDGTTATRTSQFVITGVNSASATNVLTLDGDGTITTIGKRIIGVVTSSAGTLTIGNAESYIFNGSTTTWTLPAVSGTTGTIYYLKNIGSGSITLNSNAGGNDIYTSSAVNTTTITAGSAITLISNGTYFTVN